MSGNDFSRSFTPSHPIIFSGPMVRAILEGRKTQTRRVIKPQPDISKISAPFHPETRGGRQWVFMARDDFPSYSFATADFKVPYAVGDRLWARETWQEFFEDEIPNDRKVSNFGRMGTPAQPERRSAVAYRADGEMPAHPEFGKALWRSPIHMPRWASRLTLVVSDVRVQRVREISDQDAEAEGVYSVQSTEKGFESVPYYRSLYEPPELFRMLWDWINAKRGYGWDVNPWVVALTFGVKER